MGVIRQMLADDIDWRKYRGTPVLGSPKIDGVRATVDEGKPMSRQWKVIPNWHIQNSFARLASVLNGLDGELVCGPPGDPKVYSATMKGAMAFKGEPDFTYLVFDTVTCPSCPYQDRLTRIELISPDFPSWVTVLPQVRLNNRDEIEAFTAKCFTEGYEGAIIRDPYAPYKFGRSTATEGGMLKVKKYADEEAIVTGSTEWLWNDNPAFFDEQGYTAHRGLQANLRPGGMLGALECALLRDPGIRFKIGSGFTMEQRTELWKERDTLIGLYVKFRHLPHGSLGPPRHPVFLGFRDPIDMP